MIKILIIPEKCGACRICELVCSYHHTKIFGRRPSSIEIYKEPATGDVEFCIHEMDGEGHHACDLCADEPIPLCVKWCPAEAIVRKKG